jgi:hypothetical protein
MCCRRYCWPGGGYRRSHTRLNQHERTTWIRLAGRSSLQVKARTPSARSTSGACVACSRRPWPAERRPRVDHVAAQVLATIRRAVRFRAVDVAADITTWPFEAKPRSAEFSGDGRIEDVPDGIWPSILRRFLRFSSSRKRREALRLSARPVPSHRRRRRTPDDDRTRDHQSVTAD